MRRIFTESDGRLRPGLRAALFVIFGLLCTGARESPIAQTSPLRLGVAFLAVCAGLLLGTWIFLRVLDHRSFRTLGLWFYSGWTRDVMIGFAIGSVMVVSVLLFLFSTGLAKLTGFAWTAKSLAELCIWGCILFPGAAAEELLLRGYGFQRLIESIGPVASSILFSILFSLLHLVNPNANKLGMLNTVLTGILFAVVYLKTRALWMPIGLHWIWNFLLGPVFSFPVSGNYLGPRIFLVEIREPAWLSGLKYGPEGSLILTIILIVVTVWLAQTKSIGIASDVQNLDLSQ